MENFDPRYGTIVPSPSAVSRYRRLMHARKERVGTTSGDHDHEMGVMYGALIEFTS